MSKSEQNAAPTIQLQCVQNYCDLRFITDHLLRCVHHPSSLKQRFDRFTGFSGCLQTLVPIRFLFPRHGRMRRAGDRCPPAEYGMTTIRYVGQTDRHPSVRPFTHPDTIGFRLISESIEAPCNATNHTAGVLSSLHQCSVCVCVLLVGRIGQAFGRRTQHGSPNTDTSKHAF